jgi:hypothetical protein
VQNTYIFMHILYIYIYIYIYIHIYIRLWLELIWSCPATVPIHPAIHPSQENIWAQLDWSWDISIIIIDLRDRNNNVIPPFYIKLYPKMVCVCVYLYIHIIYIYISSNLLQVSLLYNTCVYIYIYDHLV